MFKKTLIHFSFLSSVFFLGAGCNATSTATSTQNDDESSAPSSSQRITETVAVATTHSIVNISVEGGNWGHKFPVRWYSGIGNFLVNVSISNCTFTWHPDFGKNAPVLKELSLIGCRVTFGGDSTRQLGLNTPQLQKLDLSGSVTLPDATPMVALINMVGAEDLFARLLRGDVIIALTKEDGAPYTMVEIAERVLEFGKSQAASHTTMGTWSKVLSVGFSAPNSTTFSEKFRAELPALVREFKVTQAAASAN